jgi:hypothetical protein
MAYGIIKELITTLLILITIASAGYFSWKGKDTVTKIRTVPGLKAIDDAIGRATEMGKPLLFTTLHGSGTGNSAFVQSSGPSHLAGLSVLGYVAKEIAKRDAKLVVPLAWPDVAEMGTNLVNEAYRSEGKIAPPDTVMYISSEQMGYAIGTAGVMARTEPASILMFGPAAAETLILAESANKYGSFNIGASAANQAVYFITSCDYVMIGEELFIAGAYLTQDKLALGSIKGQDYPKFALLIYFAIAVIMAFLGMSYDTWLNM